MNEYDDEFNNEEINQPQNNGRFKSSASDFLSGARSAMNTSNSREDVDRINNRGKNESDIYKREKKDEDDQKQSRGLDKEGLKDKEKTESNSKNPLKGNTKDGLKGNAKDAVKGAAADKAKEKAAGEAAKKLLGKGGTLLKLKIIGILLLVFGGLFLIIGVVAGIVFSTENYVGATSSMYGVSETDTEECTVEAEAAGDCERDGMYTSNKYQYVTQTCDLNNYSEKKCLCDPMKEDCNEVGTEDLIYILESDDKCKIDSGFRYFLDNISSIFTGKKFNDTCQLIRYIRVLMKRYNEDYNITIDPGLVLATIFYGYGEQSSYLEYDNPTGVDRVEEVQHYEVLKNIIEDGTLTRDSVDRIVKNTVFEKAYPYFNWQSIPQCKSMSESSCSSKNGVYDSENECCNVKTYTCIQNNIESYYVSEDKWKMFVRYNDELCNSNKFMDCDNARKNVFSIPGFMKVKNKKILDNDELSSSDDFLNLVGSGFVYDTNMNDSWNSTSTQCNGTMSIDELKTIYTDGDFDEAAINNAHNFYINRNITGTVDTDIYKQYAENYDNLTPDTFKDKTITYSLFSGGVKNAKMNVAFDYKFGFGHNEFPGYSQAEHDSNRPLVVYDTLLTPKQIENVIQEALDKKDELNDVLLFNGQNNEISYYTAGSREAIKAMGANCGKYLSAPYENITVHVNDCDGNPLLSTDVKDYLIGSLYGEIGYNTNDDYVITQGIANLSFLMGRSNNYSKGNDITIRSGNCDQLYCSPEKGCHSQTAGIQCGSSVGNCTSYLPGTGSNGGYWAGHTPMTSEQYSKYSTLVDTVMDYLIVNDKGTVETVQYNSTASVNWENEAKSGQDFQTILSNHYTGTTLIQCSEGNPTNNITTAQNVCNNYIKEYDKDFNNKVVEIAENKIKNNNKTYDNSSNFVKEVLNETYKELGISKTVPDIGTANLLREYASNSCVEKSSLKPGDVIFYSTNSSNWNGIGHIAIFAGYNSNNQITVFESNSAASCASIKGSTCDTDNRGVDSDYYKKPANVIDQNASTIAAFTRWY